MFEDLMKKATWQVFRGHLDGAVLGSSISCAPSALATVIFPVCLTPMHVSCAYSVTTQDIPSHPCLMLTDCNQFQVQANAYCIFHDNSKLLQYLRASHLPSAWRTNEQRPSETSERPPCHTLTRLLYSEPPRKLRRGQRQ
jgi:hypothetical protein